MTTRPYWQLCTRQASKRNCVPTRFVNDLNRTSSTSHPCVCPYRLRASPCARCSSHAALVGGLGTLIILKATRQQDTAQEMARHISLNIWGCRKFWGSGAIFQFRASSSGVAGAFRADSILHDAHVAHREDGGHHGCGDDPQQQEGRRGQGSHPESPMSLR